MKIDDKRSSPDSPFKSPEMLLKLRPNAKLEYTQHRVLGSRVQLHKYSFFDHRVHKRQVETWVYMLWPTAYGLYTVYVHTSLGGGGG